MKAIVTVIGRDQVGIIAGVCSLLAKNNVNILDISQTILNDHFTMIMHVDLAASQIPFNELSAALTESGEKMALAIHMQREDIFEAMHRI